MKRSTLYHKIAFVSALTFTTFSLFGLTSKSTHAEMTPITLPTTTIILTTQSVPSPTAAGSEMMQQTTNGTITPTATATITPTPTSQITTGTTSDTKGEITKIDTASRKISVKDGSTVNEVTVPENVQITKDGKDVGFSDLAVNDSVTVSSSNGQVLSIASTSSSAQNLSKVAIPLGIGLLILLAALYYFLKKNNNGHIKTTTEQIR